MLANQGESRARKRAIFRLFKQLLIGMKGDNSGTRKMPQLPAHDCKKNRIIPPGDAVNLLIDSQ
ncbi:hypothetical protein WMO13_02260 [Ignatzschineria larvae DSM 13226]|uniref:Uncharacterized protein n=1 Tax=Ignatzschineria larvae DSM 13226 TaxID=1111732 RepID=A0ABZ3C487_9GAMM|nr:hypothetical protein [Ignatzschineria larvae]